MTTGRRARTAVVLTAVLLGAACAGSEAEREKPPTTTLVMNTGPEGGGFYPLGKEVAAALGSLMPTVTINAVASGGALFNVTAIQSGEADLAFTFADVAYMAYNGQLNGPPFERLRGIAVLQLAPVSLVARSDLPIKGPADLRGRSVGLGPAGSATALTASLVLQAFGLGPSDFRPEKFEFQEAATRVLNGSLDAMFDTAINQSASLKRAIEGGARLIPIEGRPTDTLRSEYPFLRLTVVPRDMYPSMDRSVHTIGVDGLLICRRDLDEALVYEVTKQLIISLQPLAATGALRLMDLDQAPATTIPLHDGAARFYRERELSR